MPFFVPSRLIELEYLGGDEEVDEEYYEEAKNFRKEMDFAFFVVNFNYSKSDYEDLTPKEKSFIMKAWENKLVTDTTLIRNASLNAQGNIHRKKGKKFIDLWTKKRKKLDKDVAENNLKIIEESNKDDSWIDKIYKINGMRRPQKKGG